jgi:hypothetical protein
MTTKENFRNFLVLNDCYNEYCSNILAQKRSTFEEFTGKRVGFVGIINSSFSWSQTPQGQNFWSQLNDKWNRAATQGDKFQLKCRSIW